MQTATEVHEYLDTDEALRLANVSYYMLKQCLGVRKFRAAVPKGKKPVRVKGHGKTSPRKWHRAFVEAVKQDFDF